jgi:hypothetical protein
MEPGRVAAVERRKGDPAATEEVGRADAVLAEAQGMGVLLVEVPVGEEVLGLILPPAEPRVGPRRTDEGEEEGGEHDEKVARGHGGPPPGSLLVPRSLPVHSLTCARGRVSRTGPGVARDSVGGSRSRPVGADVPARSAGFRREARDEVIVVDAPVEDRPESRLGSAGGARLTGMPEPSMGRSRSFYSPKHPSVSSV